MATTTMTTLPVELIMEILSYLPAESLISSCKFVCKAWCIVVKDPDFVKMHFNRGSINGSSSSSSNGNNNNNKYHQSLMCISGKNELFQLHFPLNFEDDVLGDDHHTVTITPTKLDVESFPFPFDARSNLVGSCNGLLCIHRGELLVLLNLCTKRYKLSPREPFSSPRGRSIYSMSVSYGFGCVYDSTTTIAAAAEYKVVRIVGTRLASKSEVKVYSMTTNSWTTVKDITNDIRDMIPGTIDRRGVFLNGALHWMNQITSDLVCFDLRSEEFRIMPRPPFDDDEAYEDFRLLMIMRGCLCRIRIRDSCNFEVSIMNEYGISESWTQEFVITLSFGFEVSHGLMSFVCLGDQILITKSYKMRERLVLYDMNKKMSVYIHGNGVPDGRLVYFMAPCIDSLVSLKSSVLPLSKDRKRRMESLDTEIK